MNSKTVVFDRPVTIGGKEHQELRMRQPLVRDMIIVGVYENPAERDARMIANLTDHAYDEIVEMEWQPYKKLRDQLTDFLY